MKMPTLLRYFVVLLLFVLSVIPQVILLPILGDTNLLLLIAIWVVLFLSFVVRSKTFVITLSGIAALLMAIPPMPNYVFPSNLGVIQFQFIGWDGILSAWYSELAFFVIYFAIFALASLLAKRQITRTG